jgi:ribosomal protein L25 (general stress protein Ctc)
MSEQLITIEANLRTGTGKSYSRKLRATGKIPANLLQKSGALMLELDPKWLSKAWKTGKVFNLKFQGVEKPVLIHELQISPVKRTAVHVDLMYK